MTGTEALTMRSIVGPMLVVAVAAMLGANCSGPSLIVECRDVMWAAESEPWHLRLDEVSQTGYLELDLTVPEGEPVNVAGVVRGVLYSTAQKHELTLPGTPGVGANAFQYDWVFTIDRQSGQGTLERGTSIDYLDCEFRD
jgi:hypothetical protein